MRYSWIRIAIRIVLEDCWMESRRAGGFRLVVVCNGLGWLRLSFAVDHSFFHCDMRIHSVFLVWLLRCEVLIAFTDCALHSSHRVFTNDITPVSPFHSLPQPFPALDSRPTHLRIHDSYSRADESLYLPNLSFRNSTRPITILIYYPRPIQPPFPTNYPTPPPPKPQPPPLNI